MTTSKTIGYAILGTWMVADYHRQAIAANSHLGARLVAVGHYNPARFDEISAKFGAPCVDQKKFIGRSQRRRHLHRHAKWMELGRSELRGIRTLTNPAAYRRVL